jgi:hypothetical protein
VPLGARVARRPWPASARCGVAGTARMSPGTAILGAALALSAGWRRVGGVARRHRAALPEGSAWSHAVARPTGVAEQPGVAGRTSVAGRRGGVARPRRLTRPLRAGSARRHAVTAPHAVTALHAVTARRRVAGSRHLLGASVITRRHGRRHGSYWLAAWAVRRPAGTARVHTRRVARTRRLRSGSAGGRPIPAPPAGRPSRHRPSRHRPSRDRSSRHRRSRHRRSRHRRSRSRAGSCGP